MKGISNKKHTIDLLFPILLWAVLLICPIFTVLLGIHFYEKTTDRITSNYETRTALSYLREKIHQNDESDAISIGTLGEVESLIIEQTYGDKLYKTYIYSYENALWELMAQDGLSVSPTDGTKILDVKGFSMEETAPGIFVFSCTNEIGQTVSTTVSTISQSF